MTKLENIIITKSHRNKRGLINGLGSFIKSISGNLDSNDGERIYNILHHLEKNHNDFKAQLRMQYSLNNNIIRNFNNTIRDIQHNEYALRSKISWLNNIFQEEVANQEILFGKDLYNQLIILYNALLNTLQDIENSVTFCKLGTLHPSIISSTNLFAELKRIYAHYGDQLPYKLTFENIPKYESLIKVNCRFEESRITYFLSIPIDFENIFDLYYILPIPTVYESEFVTVIPTARYFLKLDSNEIKPLNGMCTEGNPYHCPNILQGNFKASCEEGVLQKENSSLCQFMKLKISDNQIERIPEINQYLAVFPQEGVLQVHCTNHVETLRL